MHQFISVLSFFLIKFIVKLIKVKFLNLFNLNLFKIKTYLRIKEERQEKIMANLGAMLKTQVEDEEFRIAKTVAKNQAKLAQEEFFKEMKLRKELAEIHQHRLETVCFFFIKIIFF